MTNHSTEGSQIITYIVGLAKQVEQLQVRLERMASEVQTSTSQTQHIDHTLLQMNLQTSGVAQNIHDTQEKLGELTQLIQRLPQTQIKLEGLDESIQQIVSDAFMELEKHLSERQLEGDSLDITRIRLDAQRALAVELLPKLEQGIHEVALPTYQADTVNEQKSYIESLQQEVLRLRQEAENFQTRALQLLEGLDTTQPSLAHRIIFGPHSVNHHQLSELTTLIASNHQAEQYQQLNDLLTKQAAALAQHADTLAKHADGVSLYANSINHSLQTLNELRNRLLTFWSPGQEHDTAAEMPTRSFTTDTTALSPSSALPMNWENVEQESPAFHADIDESDEDFVTFSAETEEDNTEDVDHQGSVWA